jgi:hypothetical protein
VKGRKVKDAIKEISRKQVVQDCGGLGISLDLVFKVKEENSICFLLFYEPM